MRAILDTNLFISYLLIPRGPIKTILHSALLGKFHLLIPEAVLDELGITVISKPYLRQRIQLNEMAFLYENLRISAKIIPTIPDPIPAVTRDPKDDYLIAYALAGDADFLVTGDGDLLALEKVGKLHILTPADFVSGLTS